jgi:uncharacterized protein
MPEYLTPGVYVEEVASGVRPIESQSTSTPCFVGTGGNPDAPTWEPTPITNWSQFARIFLGEGAMTPLAHAVFGFFQNAGTGRCYVLDTGPGGSLDGTAERPGLSVLEGIQDISMVAAPGSQDYQTVIDHCERMRDRLAILDPPQALTNPMALTKVATATPPADPAPDDEPGPAAADHPRTRSEPAAAGPPASPYAALYYPWLMVKDLNTAEAVLAPPSGHMAGIWARTDYRRGVHKAPANEALNGVIGLQRRVTPAEQGELNAAGVNVLRIFDNFGIRPWGARTLARDTAPQWRYIPVRRLFCMIEESIALGTSWIVFEPNDRLLWNLIRRDIGAYLTRLWHTGALMGSSPEEAFFVKCDEETNPPEVVDAGRVVAVIGIAPVKPAEFVVFQISQFSGGTITEEANNHG